MFYLAPHPKLDRPQRGSPRMFTIDWVEKYFSRVKAWHVVVIWVPLCLWFLARGFRVREANPTLVTVFFLGGVVIWTLVEYGLHRFCFHFKPREDSEMQKEVAFLIHGIHHDYPWDADRLVMPPTVAVLIAALLWWPMKLSFGTYFFPVFSGVIAGYVWYDLTHYYLHHGKPTTRLGKWLRKYHMVHHFATPHVRYGITTPLWDLLFGTYPHDQYNGAEDEPVEVRH